MSIEKLKENLKKELSELKSKDVILDQEEMNLVSEEFRNKLLKRKDRIIEILEILLSE